MMGWFKRFLDKITRDPVADVPVTIPPIRVTKDTTQLSEHFTRSEFACNCGCGQDTVDVELLPILERVRVHFDEPTTIISGNRCEDYNRTVGGATNSQHPKSRAADIVVQNVSPATVHAYLDPWHTGGLGEYPTFTHVDSRSQRARWSG